MQGFQKHFGWAVVLSELSHVFCCVIPTLVTILSAFANVGLFIVSPDGMLMDIHNVMHAYEIPVIVFSGAMVVLGWVAHFLSRNVDCHDTGCGHPPCVPQKSKNSRVLIIASLLFAANIVIYFGVHRNVMHLDMFRPHPLQRHLNDDHLHEIQPKSL
ncbi:MAG: hypothetical protein A3J37_04925 [Alphaproteobacteria bacterium RIFCSPHIGHO2_12_FULL_45_9]|nr:MAG: hypothetical protein A3B66_04560 [Alphaproteobacteria bacterium RIFCSPHIGHO2_02_FULL_46_13]OFW93876.1 MAG: hypothetical protein A3J37_04925 [Alphaproteobacteria bacterium RIFCSPHIGHO2_12_FULL_45_9]